MFANLNIFYYFIVKHIVDQFKLKLQHFFNKLRLKNNKIVNIVDFTKFK